MSENIIIYGSSSLISLELIKILDKDTSKFYLFCRNKNEIEKFIIKNNFDKNKREIIEDQLLISIISQNHENLNLDSNNLLIWIMKYVENFTISSGKFFTYYQDLIPDVDKKTFINFIIAHKIASLYLKVDSNKEIELVNTLNNIIESNSNTSIIIKNAILDYGLVNSTNETNKIDLNHSNFSTSYYSIYYWFSLKYVIISHNTLQSTWL